MKIKNKKGIFQIVLLIICFSFSAPFFKNAVLASESSAVLGAKIMFEAEEDLPDSTSSSELIVTEAVVTVLKPLIEKIQLPDLLVKLDQNANGKIEGEEIEKMSKVIIGNWVKRATTVLEKESKEAINKGFDVFNNKEDLFSNIRRYQASARIAATQQVLGTCNNRADFGCEFQYSVSYLNRQIQAGK